LARPVTVETAKLVATHWIMEKKGEQAATVTKVLSSLGMEDLQAGSQSYYTFNVTAGGWVIVAGDDVAYPIIAYGLQGSVDGRNMPLAFTEWMSSVVREITAAARQSQSAVSVKNVAATNKIAWTQLKTGADGTDGAVIQSVSPLLKTTWSQGKYYNSQCPYDASSDYDHRALVGCVATAMSQVMKYHNWPETGVGSHSYYHPTYGTLTADFGATHYAWGSMPWGSVTAYNSAVAKLLYHAGVAVEMDYSPVGSGAYTGQVAEALKSFFRYKKTAVYEHRSSYPVATWESKLRVELDAGRPLVYRGRGSGGHAFVCDGYSGTSYFHFNWGWNGWYDGYFYLSSLTPGGEDFSNYQAAIFGIEPEGKPEKETTGINSILSLLLGAD